MINTICVCGAGTMGSGIAQLAAQAGFTTIQYDLNTAMLEKSRQVIEKNLDKLVEKGRMLPVEKSDCLARIVFTANSDDCIADLVIEAIIEQQQAKTELFARLATVNSDTTIFATNTSSISVAAIAASFVRPDKIIGMHFFNPAPLMKLVEIIKTDDTDPSAIELIAGVARDMGKIPVVCKDVPGFIVNRVARHYYLEAMKLVEDGVADMETIDTVMQATGFKMGPFALMDLIGLDINYHVSSIVWEALGKPERLQPSALQEAKVKAGELGRKSGRGFYQY